MEYARLIVDTIEIRLIYNERKTIERDRVEIRHSYHDGIRQIDCGHVPNSVDLQ